MELSASIFEGVEHTFAFYERIITRLWSETRKVPSIPEEIAFLKKHQAPFLSLAHTFLLSHPLTLCIHGFRHYGASFFSSAERKKRFLCCAHDLRLLALNRTRSRQKEWNFYAPLEFVKLFL